MSDAELTFRGTSAQECEEFIRALRRRGHADGKLRDDKYMADIALISFAGPALRWYTRLDRNTRDSWDLLQVALIDNYTDEDDVPSMQPLSISESVIPTPAAAAPTSAHAIPKQRPISPDVPGRIRIIADDPSAGKYISANLDVKHKICLSCDDPSGALIVQSTRGPRVSNGSSTRSSFLVLNPIHELLPGLAIILAEKIRRNPAKTRYAHMILTSVMEKKVRMSYKGEGMVKSVVWDWSYYDGEIRVVWEEEDGACQLVTAVNIENKRILHVNNFEAFCADSAGKTYSKARLVFEPI